MWYPARVAVPRASDVPLPQLEVLAVDCQATASAPRGHLLEIGWARVGAVFAPARACLVRLPECERVPPAVARITGITEQLLRDGVGTGEAWRKLSDAAAALSHQPAPTVVHYARFERPFLQSLACGAVPFDIVCTHEIARRLLPDLPRRSLRALAGYFGHGVGALRRSADHVEATAFVWRELVRLLQVEGISTWGALLEWLDTPAPAKRPCRVWPLPRDVRLSVPDAPGIYRLLRTSGDVLYVGKASSLRHRVNSYFRKQSGVAERMLEMLSQTRAISFEVAASALEAALIEPDEIKRLQPPYNVALGLEGRELWFTAADLSVRSRCPTSRCRLGPFPSAQTLEQFAALAQADTSSLGRGRWAPEAACFAAGYGRLIAAHPELSRDNLSPHARLLRLGTRLWREGRRDRDEDGDEALAVADREIPPWTPELVQVHLERLALRAAHARRRARWLTRMVDTSVMWTEPGAAAARLLVIEDGEIIARTPIDSGETPPVPPGHARPVAARREAFTVARFDRVRVLTTELKRLVAAGAPVSLRFGVGPALGGARLARALSWV